MSYPSWLCGALALTYALAATAQPTYTQSFSEAQLYDFARASVELDALNTGLGPFPTARSRERAAATARVILERHNLDARTYNAILARARNDRVLSARIRALRMRDNVGT